MRVLGVDPGYDRVGLAVMEYENGVEKILYSTCLETNKEDDLHIRFQKVGNTITRIVKKYKADTLGIETLFFNKNVKTAMSVAEARGIIIYTALEAGCQIYEFSPQAIKIATTGYGNSDKIAVTAMVKQLITDAPTDAIDDEYDAIAVGITCLAHHGRNK
ncbi:MAG: crossover junction endodeoxyribonuclease RuvC [Candidatus Paceibacteria bacterium]|jgi:crossover junction endodeoxyribonuclease RuvC